MNPLTPDQQWASEYVGRLWNMPLVRLRPFATTIPELWSRAPDWLRRRAARPLRPAQGEVWELLRDRERLGTRAWPQVPLWIPQYEVGYVLDFFLPEFGVNVQIDRWEPCFDEQYSDGTEPPQCDIDLSPDHPLNYERPTVLEQVGIEALSFYEDLADPGFARDVVSEVRCELGFGRPPWLQRDPRFDL